MPTRHLAATLTALVIILTSCAREETPLPGAPLPPTNAEQIMALLEDSNQPVVLNVWASWCIPCRSEAPLLEQAYTEFGNEVRFIGVNVADTQSGAQDFIAEFGLSFENLFDAPRSVPAALGGSGVPLTFFFAAGGELVHYQPGVIDERMLALQIDELLPLLMEFTLLWAAATGMGFALLMAKIEKRSGLIPAETASLSDLILGAAVTGLITGRLAAMILAGTSPFTHPGDMLIVRSGVDTGFASLGALAFVSISARRNLAATVAALAPAGLAGLAGWHAGCLYRGACLGTTSTLPWAVAQEGSTVTRHPVEVYAALLFLAAALGLLWSLRRGGRVTGAVGAAGLGVAGAIRLATEPLRPSLGSGPVGWYLAAIGMGLIGVVVVRLRSRA